MKNSSPVQDGTKELRDLALHYMAPLVETARESFLILNSDQRVIMANQTFYENFHVSAEQTENQPLYDLGNGQWDIPELKRLMTEILPHKRIIKNYEVVHVFETIGKKQSS